MWTLRARDDVPLWRLDAEPHGQSLAFSTRRGGQSAPPYDTLNLGLSTSDQPANVRGNRGRLLRALDLDLETLATAGQIHGARVVSVDGPGLTQGCDGLVTRTRGLTLAVTGADCMTILFSTAEVIGVAHAGWRGARAGIAEATLASVCEEAGLPPDQVAIHFGPCIRDCCYEVGPEVAEQFPTAARRRVDAVTFLSVPGAVGQRLLDAGAAPDAIHDTGACTACEPHWYFSHRRDRGVTGRQWGVISLVDHRLGA